MCLGKMLDKQKNRGRLQPYLRNVNVRWFSFDLEDLKEMRFEDGEETRFGLKQGDLVICEGGEPGRAAVWKEQAENAKIQKALHRVRFRPDEYDPYFAMYYLYFGTITSRFDQHYTGTTIKHLTGTALSQVCFPLPPVNEQRRIVAKIEELFSDLDAGVAALERIRGNLRRYRAAVLKAAVEGKLTEEWRAKHPKSEPASKLLERILSERRQKWEEDQLAKFAAADKSPPKGWREKYVEPVGPATSGLPELPEGWCWASVEQLGHASLGKMLDKQKHQAGEKLPYLRNVNVRWGYVDSDDLSEMYFEEDELNRFGLQAGDLLVCEGGEPGRAAVWDARSPEMKFQKALHRVRFYCGVQPAYLVYLLEFYAKSGRLEAYFTGSTIKHFTHESFVVLPVPLPPTSEQEQITAEVERALSIVAAADYQIQANLKRAARLRQSILKRAFEGRLVPQDPTDEPADKLLERIRQERATTNGSVAPRTRRGRASKHEPDEETHGGAS